MKSAKSAKPADADRIPPELMRVALVSGFGSLLLNLSSTTLNVALHRLIGDLHTTLEVAQWTVTGYLLSLTLVLPLFRFTAERVGLRRLYLVSLVGFTITSALCAGAWSIHSLIAFRVLQGAVGGLLTPIAQAMTARHAREGQMGRLLSIVALSVLAAPLAGPLVGGLLVQRLSWRWIFLVNVPLGALCTLLCVRYLPRDEAPGRPGGPGRLDVVGLALLSPGMALLTYGVSRLRTGGGLGFIGVSFALLAAFGVYAGGRPQRALLDLRLFRQPIVAAALATFVLHGIVTFGGQLLLPLYYQQVRGQSPLGAGLLLGLQGVGMMISLPRIGRLTDRYDPGKLAMGGAALTLTSTLAFAFAGGYTSMILLGAALVVRGVGLGATGNPTLTAVYRHLPKSEVENATTAVNVVQRMGAPLGTVIMAVLLQWQMGLVPKAEAFARTFGVNVALSALTILSAAFLVGGGRSAAPTGSSRCVA